jgi:hypothetical protein
LAVLAEVGTLAVLAEVGTLAVLAEVVLNLPRLLQLYLKNTYKNKGMLSLFTPRSHRGSRSIAPLILSLSTNWS